MKKLYKGFIMALSMFTILPTPYVEWDDEGVKNMMKFYPIIGLIVGAFWSMVYFLLDFFHCSIVLKSVLVMIVHDSPARSVLDLGRCRKVGKPLGQVHSLVFCRHPAHLTDHRFLELRCLV